MEQNTQSNENNSQIGTNADSEQIEKKDNKKAVLLAVIVVVVVLGIVASYFLFFSDKKDDNTPVLENEKVEEVKIDKELDSDQDGLPDYIEKVLRTDLNNPDTDGDGIYDIIGLLKSIAKEMKINIFIINHSPLPIEHFDYRIQITKNDGFSDIELEELDKEE